MAVSVFKGNSGDPKTLLPQVDKIRVAFGIKQFVLVGDRGMITQKQVEALRDLEGCGWISVLRPGAINKLVKGGLIQQGLFDERNLFELTHPDFPGERLVACRNLELAALDGIYVVRSSVSAETMSTDQTVRSYKLLSNVERAFRCFKSVDLMVRPIRHWLENRVRAHLFLCMLAYYVQWHMTEAWRPLLFADEDQDSKLSRDPVAPAERSDAALQKVQTKQLEDGSLVHSFRTLLDDLARIVSNLCRCPGLGAEAPTFTKTTTPNTHQQRALNLLQSIRP